MYKKAHLRMTHDIKTQLRQDESHITFASTHNARTPTTASITNLD